MLLQLAHWSRRSVWIKKIRKPTLLHLHLVAKLLRYSIQIALCHETPRANRVAHDRDYHLPSHRVRFANFKEEFAHAHSEWSDAFANAVLGVMVLFKKRFSSDNGVHEHTELLHALCGDTDIRAHDGTTYVLNDATTGRS